MINNLSDIENKYRRYPTLMGGIIGDISGSRFEFNPIKIKDFELLPKYNFIENNQREVNFENDCKFTDDTVMTIAIASALLGANRDYDNLGELVVKNMQYYGNQYPIAGYGFRFGNWLKEKNPSPYNSFGNGSAMRISAVPYFAKNLSEVKRLSRIVTEVTHNHPEGIKGVECVAVCIWLAFHGHTKENIKSYVEENYYKLDFNYDDLVENYEFDETCQGSVPQSIYAFLISKNYEDALKIAISMGGDADTMACIAGAIAEAYYGLPKELEQKGMKYLSDDLKDIVLKFQNRYVATLNDYGKIRDEIIVDYDPIFCRKTYAITEEMINDIMNCFKDCKTLTINLIQVWYLVSYPRALKILAKLEERGFCKKIENSNKYEIIK